MTLFIAQRFGSRSPFGIRLLAIFVVVPALICFMRVATAAERVEILISGVEGEILENVQSHLGIMELQRDTSLPGIPSFPSQEQQKLEVSEKLVRRLHKRAKKEIRQALQPYGFYDPKIETSLRSVEGGWQAHYRIDTGQPVLLRRVEIRLEGEGKTESSINAVLASFALKEGDRLDHPSYKTLKERLMKVALKRGYLDARFSRSEVRIEPLHRRSEIHLVLDTGPRYYFGSVTIEQDILHREFVERFIQFTPGEPFSTDLLLALQTALSSSEYFSRVEVQTRRDQAENFRIPVSIKTEPRKPRTYAFGLGFATDTGPRATAGVIFRRINRRGHQLLLDTRVSQIKQEAGVQYQIPLENVMKDRLIFRAAAEHEEIDEGDSTKYTLGASHNQGWLGAQRSLYANLSWESFSLGNDEENTTFLIPGINLSRQKMDDPLFSRSGHSWNLDARGATEALIGDTSFARFQAEGRMVFPLGKKARLLLRGQLGAIEADEFDKVPATERFYAGGDRSVRGYGYQELGPSSDGENVGGRYLLVGSIEADYLVRGNIGAAAFFDTGNADNSFLPDLQSSIGLGLRWKSPIGMARLDVAKALDGDGDYRLHLSIGPDL